MATVDADAASPKGTAADGDPAEPPGALDGENSGTGDGLARSSSNSLATFVPLAADGSAPAQPSRPSSPVLKGGEPEKPKADDEMMRDDEMMMGTPAIVIKVRDMDAACGTVPHVWSEGRNRAAIPALRSALFSRIPCIQYCRTSQFKTTQFNQLH